MTDQRYFRDPDVPDMLIRVDSFSDIDGRTYCRYTSVCYNADYCFATGRLGSWYDVITRDNDQATKEEFNEVLQKSLQEMSND